MGEVSRLARLLAEARPSMPSIANLAYMVFGNVEKLTSTGMALEEAVESAVRSAVKDYQRRLRDTIKEAVKLLSGYRCILTHSYSSTLATAIELCEDLKIIVTESRPDRKSHTSELQSPTLISYAVFSLKKKNTWQMK